jgi:tryptophan synthase beta chain
VDSAFESYLGQLDTALYAIGSVVGPHPFPMMVRDFQSIVGIEAREQYMEMTDGELPDHVVACVGGGSNAMGIFSGFIDDPVELYAVEPLGRSTKMGEHAATIGFGKPGVLHGFKSILLQDEQGEPAPVHSIASGLDYPGVGPEQAYLHDIDRVHAVGASDEETVDAFYAISQYEGIIPALESAHAIAYAMKLAREKPHDAILVNLSGRGDKDIDYVVETFGVREWKPE